MGNDHCFQCFFFRVHGRESSGQNLIEFALVLPVLLLLMVALIDLGAVFLTQSVVTNAAWEGARAGATAVDPEHGDREIIQAVRDAAYGLDEELLEITIDPSQDEYPRNGPYPLPRGENLSVVVRYSLDTSILGDSLVISGNAVTKMEYQNP